VIVSRGGFSDGLYSQGQSFPIRHGTVGLVGFASLAPFLTGRTDTHREWILSFIGTSQMLRSKRWLLEAVNPILGLPRGRFYDCGTDRTGKGYRDVRPGKASGSPAAASPGSPPRATRRRPGRGS